MKMTWRWRVVAASLAVAVVLTLPGWWCRRGARGAFDGNPPGLRALALGAKALVLDAAFSPDQFHNQDKLFNGEWFFGSYFTAGCGFAQLVSEHPDLAAEFTPAATECVNRLLNPETRAFDTAMWGGDALASLDGNDGHAAYLGYLNFLLGLERRVNPATPHAALNDRISAALARRLLASPIGLLETYPNEVYPVDNGFVAGSLGLHERNAGTSHRAALDHWRARMREKYIDPASGLLIQAVNVTDGSDIDAPRASGTALGLWPIQSVDPAMAADLYRALVTHQRRTFAGFAAMREYAPGHSGLGDIDSGPVVGGIGLSPTGFALAGARMHGDFDTFRGLYASAHLFGAPAHRDGRLAYISGGALGNAILFAMLTAPRAEKTP